jgi:hypothetical protein
MLHVRVLFVSFDPFNIKPETGTMSRGEVFTILIDETMRRQLRQWTMDNFKPYSSLVRNLLRDYFAGKRMAKIGEVAK